MATYFMFAVSLVFSLLSHAKERLQLPSRVPVTIDYEISGLNKSPTEIEQIYLYVRDAQSGKMVKVILEETDMNTGLFKGHFSIIWTDQQITPEVYLPPQSIAKRDQIETINELIKEGRILRRPFFLRGNQRVQYISVFESKEQALDAYRVYQENTLNKPIAEPQKQKPLVDEAALATQLAAQKLAEALKLAQEAKQRETLRLELAEAEKRRQEELKRRQAEMTEAEKRARRAQAKKLAEEALALYKGANYIDAEIKFRASTELDPQNLDYYYQYGVTLYRNDKFNEALVVLNLAQDTKVNPNEKSFFKGLSYLKLKEYDSAVSNFSKIVQTSDPELAPSASFYVGIIEFTRENLKPAKQAFEYTLDNSKDAKLGEQAELYIEQIANLERFLSKRKHPFTFRGTLGFGIDSNVLSLSDSALATASDAAGVRLMTIMGLDYRMVFSEHHEFLANLGYIDMFTTKPDGSASATLSSYDARVISISLPYKYKGKAFDMTYQATLTPGTEVTYLDSDQNNERELTINSTYLKTEQTFIPNNDLFSTLSLELRSDLFPNTAENDATKISLGSNNTYFLDSKKTEAFLGSLGLTTNDAKGNDQKYSKLDLSAGYLMPWNQWSMTGVLGFASTSYGSHSSNRADSLLSLNIGMSKPISQSLRAAGTFNYTANSSTVATYSYNKYSLFGYLSWETDF